MLMSYIVYKIQYNDYINNKITFNMVSLKNVSDHTQFIENIKYNTFNLSFPFICV